MLSERAHAALEKQRAEVFARHDALLRQPGGGTTSAPVYVCHIGDVVVVNPLAQTPNVEWSKRSQTTEYRDARSSQVLSDAALLAQLKATRQVMPSPANTQQGVFETLALSFWPRNSMPLPAPYQPKLVSPALFARLVAASQRSGTAAPQVCFPVFVHWANFGAAQVLHAVAVANRVSSEPELWYVVHKLLPLGYIAGMPYAAGLWAVHSRITTRLTAAVTTLLPAEDVVTINDYRGAQWSVTYTEFLQSKSPLYDMMRRRLIAEYPHLLAQFFGPHLESGPPAELSPSGAVPAAIARLPVVTRRTAAAAPEPRVVLPAATPPRAPAPAAAEIRRASHL